MVAPWHASLDLEFSRRDAETILSRRHHAGPLRIQKPLYPEGPGVCHAIILHPPAGIVGGDQLAIDVNIGAGAHALLTTPGAGKWYRSAGATAQQVNRLRVGAGGTVEWLPQEAIVFSGAIARMQTTVDLEAGASFIGVETLCFGRRASGERFERGNAALRTEINLAGVPLWRERGRIAGGTQLLDSPIGLAGFSVSSTVLVAGFDFVPEVLPACRTIVSNESGAQYGLTQMPKLLVGRYLGHSAEAAREWFIGLWRILRPALTGCDALAPRIWST